MIIKIVLLDLKKFIINVGRLIVCKLGGNGLVFKWSVKVWIIYWVNKGI